MTCSICQKPYTRGLGEHTGPGNCLERALDFFAVEFPGFVLVAKLADGRPFVMSDKGKDGAVEGLAYLQDFIAAQ